MTLNGEMAVIVRYPTAIVELDTPYLSSRVQALCMDDPVHDVII